MQVEVREEGGMAVVAMNGEVDLSTSPRARQSILDCLTAGRSVAVEMSGVTYIDSSGVASLVEGYQAAKNQGLRFCLVGVSEAARSVLELARLDRVFPMAATLEEFAADDG